jgi:hypothetical protein
LNFFNIIVTFLQNKIAKEAWPMPDYAAMGAPYYARRKSKINHMNSQYADFVKELLKKPEFQCPVCGTERYVTDQGNHELTIHCSSPEAKFWDFDRGSLALTVAKQHWDQSKVELFLTMEDLLKCGRRDESLSDGNPPKDQRWCI